MTIFSLYSFLSNSIYVGHDLEYHLNRLVNLSKCFEEGQILPKIYPYANNGFGYAAPLFYCDLFLYPFAILYHFNQSAVICYKLCVFIYTLLGNIFLYLIIKKETNKRYLALISVILYLSANYHLQNIFIRSALGEILAMSFIPLVLHSIYKILIKHKDAWMYLGVSFSCLLMSHLISTLLYGIYFALMIIIFIIINHKDKKLIINTLLTILKGTILALLLTAWYLLPMIEQLNFQDFYVTYNAENYDISIYKENILDAFSIFSCTNLDKFDAKYMASCGLILNIFLIVSFFIKKNKYILISSIFCIILYLIILEIIPGTYLNIIQFYFRLYIIAFPLMTILAVYVLYYINLKNINICIYTLIIIIGLFNIYWINNQTINHGGNYHNNNTDIISVIDDVKQYITNMNWNPHDVSNGEYLPYTTAVNFNNDSKAIKKLVGENQVEDYIDVSNYNKDSLTITFNCNNLNNESLLIPLAYYRGYALYELINDDWKKIDYSINWYYREIQIESSVGEHTYKVQYNGTYIQYVSLAISTITICCLFFYKHNNKSIYNLTHIINLNYLK